PAPRALRAQPRPPRHGLVRLALAGRTRLDGAADRRSRLAVRAPADRPPAETAGAVPREAGLLPGLVRKYGRGPLHERAPRAVLDLRRGAPPAAIRRRSRPPAARSRRRPAVTGARTSRLAPRHGRRAPSHTRPGREEARRRQARRGRYIPIAWYPEST